MAKAKPSIPKGTRDFSPEIMVKRNYIFDIIQQTFSKYAFQPLETPSMENLSTLLGKYGEEGDKLLFRILNSGDFLAKVDDEALKNRNISELSTKIANKGLRYDLTVPFARYVVQHRNEITFPFKRYQIQPVWRADKPQKGRYREFYQCDGDVIGTDSLISEVELINIIDEVFTALNLDVTIKINNRKILKGIAEYAGAADHFMDITMAVDKLDKVGIDKVKDELIDRGIDQNAVDKLETFLKVEGDNQELLTHLKEFFNNSEEGMKGVEETKEILDYLGELDKNNSLEFDPKLARGLDYYTGTIFEVKTNEMEIGSICGGGRYDDLTGVFGLKDVSGVGISFGAERIYDVMQKLDKFPSQMLPAAKILFVNFGKEEAKYSLKLLQELRKEGIVAELYPDKAKMKKQFAYADNKSIPYVAIIGENEMQKNMVTVKDMKSGEQKEYVMDELKEMLKAGEQ
jgi:histidyl-tRNA synthetase